MSQRRHPTALVAGGAGFIGSHIAKRFHQGHYAVTVIDGLLEGTGGKAENLREIISDARFFKTDIRHVDELHAIVEESDVVVDCMGWTSHRLALQDPIYDLRLNAESHLYLIRELQGRPGQKVIYLGSRGQYGSPQVSEIREDTPMIPEDVQGIHKVTAESYYRVYSKFRALNVVSLRFSNCFGENQALESRDIGLVGGFIRDILQDREVEVFGKDRKRNLVYAGDLAEVVLQLAQKPLRGFSVLNLSGQQISIEILVKVLIELAGKGSFRMTELPTEIQNIEIGNAHFSDERLRAFLGEIPMTDLRTALSRTVRYFEENLIWAR